MPLTEEAKQAAKERQLSPGGGTGVSHFLALTCQKELRQLKGFRTDTELDLFLLDKFVFRNENMLFFNQILCSTVTGIWVFSLYTVADITEKQPATVGFQK